MRGTAVRAFQRLADVDDRYPAIAFFSVLFVYTLALVFQAVDYSRAARLFPLIVGVPLLAMLSSYILSLYFGDRYDIRVVGIFDDVGHIGERSTSIEGSRADRYRREFAMVLWIGALVALTWAIGSLPAVAVFVFTFVYVHERSLSRALLVSGVTFGFIYILFVRILGATLWRGVVPIWGLPL